MPDQNLLGYTFAKQASNLVHLDSCGPLPQHRNHIVIYLYMFHGQIPQLLYMYHIVTFLKVMLSGTLDRYKYLHGTRLMLTAIPPPARSWKNIAPAGQECGAWCSGLNFQAAWMCENWPMDTTSKGQ